MRFCLDELMSARLASYKQQQRKAQENSDSLHVGAKHT
jgi:hypothetical protein